MLSAPENRDLTNGIGPRLPGHDRDGHSLHYSLSGTDSSDFTVDERSGKIMTTLVFNFEAKSSYSLNAHVRDSFDTAGHFDDSIDAEIAVIINVSNEDDPGVLLISGTPTNGERLTASLRDEDGNHRDRIWQWWREDSTGTVVAVVGGNSGTYRLVDDDLGHVIRVTVFYADDHGRGKSATATTTPVAPRNAPPVFTVSDARRTLLENLAAGTLLGSPLVATDPEGDTLIYSLGDSLDGSNFVPFRIDRNGQIRTNRGFDYEQRQSFSFDAQVRDGRDGAGNDDEAVDATIRVTVTIRNEDEPGELLISGRLIIGQLLTASLSDPDGNPRIERWLWQREHSPGTWVTIGQDASTYTLVNADLAKQLAVTPYYTDDHGAGKSVTVAIAPAKETNDPPVFTVSGATFTLSEHLERGTLIGSPLVATDPEGDTLTYWLARGDSGVFEIDQNGQITNKALFDYERRNSYSFGVHVRDGVDSAGNDDEDEAPDASITVTIDIVNEEEPGELRISGTPARGELLTASLGDPDGNFRNLVWRWNRENSTGTSWLTIAGATSDTYRLVLGDVGTRVQVRVSYIDGRGIAKSATATTATVAPTRTAGPPVFTVSEATRTLSENREAGTRVGAPVVAADPEGDTLTYWLGGPDSVPFRIDQNGQITTKLPLDYEVQSRYRMDAHVRDGVDSAGNDDEDEAPDDTITVTIDIVNEDDPGVVVISGTPTVGELLTASLSDDDNPHSMSWRWQRANSTGPFVNIAGEISDTYTPVGADVGTRVTAGVLYTDDHGPARFATAPTVRVEPRNEPPVFTVSAATLTLSENLAAGTLVGAPLEATDPEGDTLTYSLRGPDRSYFDIDQNGQITTTLVLDFEAKSSYLVNAKVRDGLDAAGNDDDAVDDTITVTIDLVNEDDPGVVLISGTPVLGELLAASLSDPDGNPRLLTWRWKREDNTGTFVNIPGANSDTYTLVQGDVGTRVQVGVFYADHQGLTKHAAATTPRVELIRNEPPVFNVSTATRTVSENLQGTKLIGAPFVAVDPEGDTLTYSLSGTNALFLNIDRNGQISTGLVFNYEHQRSYSVDVNVRDGLDGAGNADQAVDNKIELTIDVINEDDPGEVSIAGTLKRGALLTASVSDEDGNLRDLVWRWGRWSTVILDFVNIRGANSAERILERTDEGALLQARVSYTDEAGPAKSAAGETGRITGGNVEPTFSSNRTTRALAEKSPAETNVGDPVTATPGDADPLTYSMRGRDTSSFTIDQTGQIKTKAGIDYDFDVKSSYSVVVTVRDGFDSQGRPDTDNDDAITVTINLTDVNEPPSIMGATNLPVRENHGSTIHTYTASDGDAGTTFRWGTEGVDSRAFHISTNSAGQGVIRFRNPPDYELPADFDGDNVYHLTVTVTDNGDPAMGDTRDITVTVTNVEEAGTVTIRGTPSGGEPLTATVADGDGTVSSLTWQWARGSKATGTFDDITGATSDSYRPVATDVAQYLKVTATYSDALPGRKTVSAVTRSAVGASNAEPTFDEGTSVTSTVAENSLSGTNAGNRVAATDSDNDTLIYSLSGKDASSFTIDSSNGQIKTISRIDYNFEVKSSYNVMVGVHDSKDAAGNPDTTTDAIIAVAVRLENVDEPGTVGIRLLTDTNGRQVLRSTELADPDGSVNISRTTWSRGDTAGGPFIEVARDLADYHTVVADVDKYIELSISYGDGEGPSKTVSAVTAGQIAATNSDPMFDPGAPTTLSVAENSTAGTSVGAALTASDSNDDTLKYSLSGPDAGSFEIDQDGQIKTRSGITYNFESTKNSYNVTVNVHDGKDIASVVDTTIDDTIDVAISLIDANDAPTITGGAPARSILEGTTVVGVYTASDEDASDTLTWDVESADDGDFFQISSSGELSFKIAPDFETREDADGDNDYEVTVKVTDALGLPATLPVTVTVTNVNEAPTIDAGSDSFAVDENTATTTIVQTYEASDTDAASNLTWTLGGTDAGAFSITRNSQGHGELRFRSVPDYEDPDDIPLVAVVGGNNVYDITVTVADGSESATLPVTVTVNDLNETPVVSGNNSPHFPEIEFDVDGASLTRANLTVPGTYTFADEDDRDVRWGLMSGADAEHFTIRKNANGNGVLSFKNPNPDTSLKPADFENPDDMGSNNVYRVVITADDRQNESNSVGTFTVDVTVTPVDETPEITTTGPTHATPSFAEIEYDAETADLTVADYDARDEERETITWGLGGPDAGDFTINRNSGVLSFAARPNFEDPVDGSTPPDNVYKIIVEATDASPTRNIREYPVTVTVTNVDETPEITNPPSDRSYAEIEYDSGSTATDIPIVATFSARDEEMQDITWDLSGEDAGDFTITKDPNTGNGVITFNNPPNFEDPEDDDQRNTYEFTVLATDTASRTNTGAWDYAVTVTDVNERPKFTGTPKTSFTLGEHDANEDYTPRLQASYSARDEEGRVTWSLTGPDGGDFAIDGAGVVTFAAAPSFEAPADSNGDNSYTFTVVATDVQSRSPRLTATVDVTVTVEDIEEAGTIEVDNLNPAVGDLITFVLTDPDGGIDLSPGGGFSWDIQGRSSGGAWGTIASPPRSTTTSYRADEDDTGFEIRAVAAYGDSEGPGKTAESMKTAAVAADPIINAPPRFQTGGTQRIPEVGAGVDVGERLTASDRDNDPLTWGISSGPGASFFEIGASSGQLRTLQALDFETTVLPRPFVVQVTLRDGRHPMFVTGKGRAVVALVTGPRQAASSVSPSLRLPQAVASS